MSRRFPGEIRLLDLRAETDATAAMKNVARGK